MCSGSTQVPTGRSNATLHAFNRRILAEDLVRIRRPDDRERYAASQRQARIDPNPHQIDAVIFALRRLRAAPSSSSPDHRELIARRQSNELRVQCLVKT
jgi:hypothetical protein